MLLYFKSNFVCPITEDHKGLPDFLVTAFFVRLFCVSKTRFRSKEKKRNKLLFFMSMCCRWILLSLCSSSLLLFWTCLSFQRLDSLDLRPSEDVKLAWRWWLRLKMQRAKGWVAQDTSLASWEHGTRESRRFIQRVYVYMFVVTDWSSTWKKQGRHAYLPTTSGTKCPLFLILGVFYAKFWTVQVSQLSPCGRCYQLTNCSRSAMGSYGQIRETLALIWSL